MTGGVATIAANTITLEGSVFVEWNTADGRITGRVTIRGTR